MHKCKYAGELTLGQLRPVCLSSTPYLSTLLLMPLLRTNFGNQWDPLLSFQGCEGTKYLLQELSRCS